MSSRPSWSPHRVLPVALALLGALIPAATAAADAAPAGTPAPAAAPAPATVPAPVPVAAAAVLGAPAPFLGVTLDHPSGFDADQGLLVTGVVPKSTFDHLGVRLGDRLLTVNGTALATVADFSAIAGNLTIGQTLTVTVMTDQATRTVSGVVEAISRPHEISQKTQQLANEVEALRSAVQDTAHPSLQQTLMLLKQLEADLPLMVDDFHRRYPQGEFDISIHIDILSDRSAKNPAAVTAPALPAGTPPASATAPTSAPATVAAPTTAPKTP